MRDVIFKIYDIKNVRRQITSSALGQMLNVPNWALLSPIHLKTFATFVLFCDQIFYKIFEWATNQKGGMGNEQFRFCLLCCKGFEKVAPFFSLPLTFMINWHRNRNECFSCNGKQSASLDLKWEIFDGVFLHFMLSGHYKMRDELY